MRSAFSLTQNCCDLLQEAVQDIVELREAHSEYLAKCQHACFLTLQTVHLRQEMLKALQAVLAFRAWLWCASSLLMLLVSSNHSRSF